MIPAAKQDAFKEALRQTFGVSEYEAIQQLTKGLSGSLVCKITVQNHPYLLRIVTKTDSRDSPPEYFDCMQTAANAGIAPKVHYLNIEDRISITDFIQEQPFTIDEAREKMADTVRHLHALPKFGSQLNYLDAADNFLQRFRSLSIVAEGETATLFDLYARITNCYPRNDIANLVSCHNDIKRDNIIFDGTKAWLVDWEAARLNDRYLDLAALANFVVKNEQDEAEFLERYFGEPADEYQRARFFLMSNIVHMFCFTLCTMAVAGGKPIDIKKDSPDFNEFHNRLWNAEINLGNNDEKLQYGLVHMEELQRKLNTARFDESVRIVKEYKSRNE